jgi:hypothetical protein
VGPHGIRPLSAARRRATATSTNHTSQITQLTLTLTLNSHITHLSHQKKKKKKKKKKNGRCEFEFVVVRHSTQLPDERSIRRKREKCGSFHISLFFPLLFVEKKREKWKIPHFAQPSSFPCGKFHFSMWKFPHFAQVPRRVDALVLQQSFDDGEMTALSSQSYGVVVVVRRIEHRVSEQIIDDVDVAVLDGAHQGDVLISLEKNLARFEHALHIRQSTMGSVITECVKVDRHLQRKKQTLVLCSDGTVDSADGDGVDARRAQCIRRANLPAWV